MSETVSFLKWTRTKRRAFDHTARCIVVVLLAAGLAACERNRAESVPGSYVRIALDQSQPERLLRYYFGGYVSPEPSDPFEAGIVHERSGRLYVDLESLRRHSPGSAQHLSDADGSGRIEWEEFESFIDGTYTSVRSVPGSLTEFIRQAGYGDEDPDWMRVELHGVMTTGRRRIAVRKTAVRRALSEYVDRGEVIRYPVGTAFVGEHYLDERPIETTVMRKREDGFWDFFVYAADGTLARGTSTPPRELRAPVQCVGCHLGDKLFEPEKSFPVDSRPGPHGPRRIYVDEALRDAEVVRRIDEHRKRSDTVLGLYATLFLSKLRAERREGSLDEADAALLETLRL